MKSGGALFVVTQGIVFIYLKGYYSLTRISLRRLILNILVAGPSYGQNGPQDVHFGILAA